MATKSSLRMVGTSALLSWGWRVIVTPAAIRRRPRPTRPVNAGMMALVARTAEEAAARAGATADPGAAPSGEAQPAARSLEGTRRSPTDTPGSGPAPAP